MPISPQTPLPSRLRSDAGCTPTPEPVASTTRNLAPPAGQGPDVHVEGAARAYCPRCQTTGHYGTAHPAGFR